MAPLRFRGLDIMGNWHCGFVSIPEQDIPNTGAKADHAYISNKAGCPFAYEVRKETIGQSTGFKDKDKKEVFECDMVRFLVGIENFEYDHLGIVEYNKELCRFVIVENASLFEFGYEISHVLVVGNIYENPNLLKDAT